MIPTSLRCTGGISNGAMNRMMSVTDALIEAGKKLTHPTCICIMLDTTRDVRIRAGEGGVGGSGSEQKNLLGAIPPVPPVG